MRRRRGLALLLAGAAGVGLAGNAWLIRTPATAGIPPPGRWVDAHGLRIHALCAGKGSPILLLHGNPGNVFSWTETLLPRLAKRHRVCAVDRPGHGHSERGAGVAETVQGQAGVLRAAARAVGLDRPVLVGHSWGGAAALAYALDFPDEVAGLVLLGGVAYPDDSGFGEGAERIALQPILGPLILNTVAPWLARPVLDRSLRLGFAPASPPAGYRERMLAMWSHPDALRAISADNAALTPSLLALESRYREIRVPVLIMVGEADRLVSPERHGFRLSRVLPKARLMRLPGAGHEFHQARPDLVAQAVAGLRDAVR